MVSSASGVFGGGSSQPTNTVHKDKSNEEFIRKYYEIEDKGGPSTTAQPGIGFDPLAVQGDPFKASSNSSIPEGLPKTRPVGYMFSHSSIPTMLLASSQSELDRRVTKLEIDLDGIQRAGTLLQQICALKTELNEYNRHKSELDKRVTKLEKDLDREQWAAALLRKRNASQTNLIDYNARLRFVESQIIHHKSELDNRVTKLEIELDGEQGIVALLQQRIVSQNEYDMQLKFADFRITQYKSELDKRVEKLELDLNAQKVGDKSVVKEKELRTRKKDLENDIEKCEERADSGWNLLLMGISAFGVFYGMMEKQSQSKTYGFYSLVGLACCGFLPMIISTICKMRDIETKLKIISASHQHLASDMKNMLPSESDSESQSASSRTASEPERQPLIPHPQNSQPPPRQLPRSTSFQDMMQQPLPMENFWWRYVVPTYTIGLFAMLYAIYVAFFG